MNDVPTDDPARALESLLRWYAAMGVDAAVDEMPHDRFVAPQAPAVAAEAPDTSRRAPAAMNAMPKTGAEPPIAVSAEALVRDAEARAAGAGDLEALRRGFESLPGCTLATSARMIFSGGTAGARLMIIGAAPDSDDERQGEAFAGSSGRLLDAMLRAIGLDRSAVYLTYVVPWRPPGNRPPTPLELSLCLPFTRRHIALAAPQVILCCGERAAQPLLGVREPISRLRGRWLAYEGDGHTVKVLATYSPSYLLGQPLQKRRAWTDLQMVAAELAAP
jgi:DNA polymerase